MKSFVQSLTLILSLSGLVLGLSPARPHIRAVQHQREQEHKKRTLQESLFPSFHAYSSGFTTGSGVSVDGVTTVDLSDDALNVIKVQSGMTHKVVTHAGKTAWEAVYPAGSYKPSASPLGGFGMYVGGSDALKGALANGATEVVFGYSVMFGKPGGQAFQFNKGGKLPGAFGGNGDEAFGCSGGRQDDRAECFDARLMWRKQGLGELYTYLPLTSENADVQLAIEGTIANSDYGYSVGRGAFTFPSGEWVSVLQRVKLNTIGKADGQVLLWIDGVQKIALNNVTLREDAGATIQGMQFQTFFGGSSEDWASPTDQVAYFADISGAIIKS